MDVHRKIPLLLGLSMAFCVQSASTEPAPTTLVPAPEDWAACVDRLQTQAREAGISATTVETVLGQVSPIPRVIELDRSQPEFTQTFADYFNRRVTDERVRRGRALLREHRSLLAQIQKDTGVPPQYLVAFWGLETNYGSFFGTTPTPDALATLACDPRRANYFSGELLAALKIIDAGDIPAAQMRGSWAGALGHVQFMPSVFLRYAVDADGDGRRDLWHSIPDALTSAGNFLHHLGWQAGERWGREVLLPKDFPYALAGRQHTQSLREWRALGVTDAFGGQLPALDMQASILLPAGHRGPAFLVYGNFQVIMGWNRSEFYAIAVGRLADQIAGAGRLQRPPPTDEPRFSRDDVLAMQTQLNALGFDAGTPDGILGPATRAAISRLQRQHGLVPDGHPGQEVVQLLAGSPQQVPGS